MEELSDLLTRFEAEAKIKTINLIEPNLEDVYFNNLQVWYYRNSDKREIVSEEFEPVNFVAKDPNKLVCSKMDEGIPLTEEDFIEEEIELLSTLGKIKNKNNKKRLKKYLDFLETKKENEDNITVTNANPYPEVFKDYASFKIFERLFNEYKESKFIIADFSFIYRKLWKDGFIRDYYKPEMFKDWISKDPFNIVIDNNIKTIDRCSTDDKERNYKTAIEIIKKEYISAQ